MRRPIVLLAFAVALLAAAYTAPAPSEVDPPDAQTTLPPDAATEVPGSELADLAPSDEEEPPIADHAPLSSEEIAEKLKMASADGASDPVLVISDDFSTPGRLEFNEDEFTTSYVDGAYELAVKPDGFSTAFDQA
jgi:hypothetical protein